MIPLIENGKLVTPLDCNGKIILNVKSVSPLPPGVIDTTDSRLSDKRNPVDGSVTDASVAATANIVQSKVNLDGTMPSAWIGSGSNQAAQGDLVERVANKGSNSGYVALDANGQLAVGNLPSTGPEIGTVTMVGKINPIKAGWERTGL